MGPSKLEVPMCLWEMEIESRVSAQSLIRIIETVEY